MAITDEDPTGGLLRPDDVDALQAAALEIAQAEDPVAAAEAFAARLQGRTAPKVQPGGLSVRGVLFAFLGAAGLAGSIALLYQGMAIIMETEGGFVASGGPYVIAHPAPDWVWVMPVSILAMFVFGGLGMWASSRNWGINPVIFAWMGLFIALGWNFLRFGLIDTPENLQSPWGWIVSGIVFWVMGFAPALLIIGGLREGWMMVVQRQNADARRAWTPPSVRDTTGAYLAVQGIGSVAGIVAAVALFAAVT